jgi:hypothetical protein
MILQISKNDKYTSLNDKYNICAEWLNIAQIKQNLSVDINCIINSINTGFECAGYYWYEIKTLK